MKDIAQRVRELREDNDILQTTIAKMLKCTRSTVSNYENGRDLPPDVIIAYCKYFNVSADWLLGLSTDRLPGGSPISSKLEGLASQVSATGGDPFTADQLSAFLDDFSRYYKRGALAGNEPVEVFKAFLSGLSGVLRLAKPDNTLQMVTAVNGLISASLTASDILTAYVSRNSEDQGTPPEAP